VSKNIFVTKRNGQRESIDLEKIHRVITWAAEGLANISISGLSDVQKEILQNVISFRAMLLITEIIIERRQECIFVNVFVQDKLYVERPNNKSPPDGNII